MSNATTNDVSYYTIIESISYTSLYILPIYTPYIYSLYILQFTRSYSIFRSFSKEQDCLMLGFFGILCLKPQTEALCAYSKQNVIPNFFEKAVCLPASPAVA